MSERRFIEESFPVKEVSKIASKEKNSHQNTLSALHTWWSRKPLASSRATAYAALVPEPKDVDDLNARRNFIIELSKWENSNNRELLDKARKDILKANDGQPPKVLDPFGGGGSIPLEALRLGCETYTGDLNPVAVLIQKATLEYPQKYGSTVTRESKSIMFGKKKVNPLLEDIKKCANWVLQEAKKEIDRFYPIDPDGSIPVGYYWMRIVKCQNPSCNAEIPLTPTWWLVNNRRYRISIKPVYSGKEVSFVLEGTGFEEISADFDPTAGTVSRGVVVCPKCGSVMSSQTLKQLYQSGKHCQKIAVVILRNGHSATKFRLAMERDTNAYEEACELLKEKTRIVRAKWGIEPVPDEPLPPKDSHRAVGSQIPLYGFSTWGDLFNERQKLAAIVFSDKIRSLISSFEEENDPEYAKALSLYVSFVLNRMLVYLSTLTRWRSDHASFESAFNRQTLTLIWNFGEINPFSQQRGGWNSEAIIKSIADIIKSNLGHATVSQNSATELTYRNDTFDAVITDPPYYDNVPYSYLSDFFYVWLKRSVGDLYPEFFSTSLTPKKSEIAAYQKVPKEFRNGKEFFEVMLKKAFLETRRILKPNGLAVIVYAHKTTEGWETLINSLLDSGLVMTAAWPMNTEMTSRSNSMETASLASSIYIIARKVNRSGIAFYNEVREELKKHLDRKLDRLWAEGIGGGDFFIAAIGSAIEIFGKYEKVMDLQGNIIRADRLLEDVRTIATDYAIRQILHNGFASEISDKTRLYVLWRWNYGDAKVPFDEARKLAQSCGLDLSLEWNGKGFIRKEKEFVRLLGPQDRKLKELEDTHELIDVLHKTLLLWESSKRDELLQLLSDSGFGKNDAFYRVAQAISETLPNENKEKKLLDGFLAGRERIREDSIKKHEKDSEQQGRLF